MRKSVVSAAALFLLLLLIGAPAAAAPAPGRDAARPSSSGPLTDRDADRVSDGFQPAVEAARSSDRFDVVVTFRPGRGDPVAEARRSAGDFRVDRTYGIVRGFAGEMTAAQIRALARNPNVHRIEEDILVTASLDHARADFGIERARTDFPGVTGAGVKACVADTGVDPAHEQLDSKTIVWSDFTPSGSATPVDPQGHGTHVSSILLGDGTGGPNAALFRGVAPGADLYAARVLDAGGSGEDSWIIAGIDWCVAQGVDLISMSLGTPSGSDGQDALSLAVNNAVAAGVVTVVAAGNSGDLPQSVGSPGAATGALTVGAVAEWSAPPNAPAGRHSDGVYLATFSSRGPTLATPPATKPDVAAPGVTVTAAKAGTAATYVTMSGTSMATPFVAGTVALALQANPSLTPAGVRALVEGTAQDRGPSGKDDDWGAGLLDGYAVVAEALGTGSYAPTAFPANTHIDASVANNGLWSHSFSIGSGDLDVPIAATIVVDGEAVCVFFCFGIEWSPDLDARLIAPNGAILFESACAASPPDECGIGRQETLHAMPTIAGTYRIEVYPFDAEPNNGKGGTFSVDLSRGPAGSAPPPPPPANEPPVANAGADRTVSDADGDGAQAVTLDGTGSSDPDGTIVSYAWSEGGTTIATGPTPTVTLGVGAHAITLTVTDDDGATDTDTAAVTVNANQPPTANAGADQTVADADGNGSQPVALDGSGSADPEGAIASYAWSEGGTTIATGATPTVTLGVGPHAITLTVTDAAGTADTDQVVVTVTTPPTLHVGDLDGATGGRRGQAAVVTIAVHDQNHNPVAGVVVSGIWTGGATASCTTDAAGRCSVSRNFAKKQSSLIFSVTGLAKSGSTYSSGANHDPDGDSNGTSITVVKA